MTLRFLPARGCAMRAVRALYLSAFPADERVPLWFLRLRALTRKSDFYAVYDGEAFAGLVYTVYYADLVYVFFLAVAENMRGRGIGGQVLKWVRDTHSARRVVLCIEEVDPESANYAERLRRKGFYLRNGFEETGLRMCENNVVYEILICGGELREGEYAALIRDFLGEWLYRKYYKPA